MLMTLVIQCYSQFAGARVITERLYPNCIELFNDSIRVVLEPNLGGRVLAYELNGNNVLYVDATQDGLVYQPDVYIHPSAGRFDIGPERTIPAHPKLYLDRWIGLITGNREAQMISQEDTVTGVQLIRKFTLSPSGSRLACTQVIRNISKENKNYCHWSRTFVKGGGIAMAPLNPNSRYPEKYLIYGPGKVMNFQPESEQNIQIRENVLEITGTPSQPKIITDGYQGWLAYLTNDHQLFVKTYATYPDRIYGEMAANTACLFYKALYCEIEPIGPMELVEPGKEVSFTEYWYLFDYQNLAQKKNKGSEVMEIIDHLSRP